ncbi:hypothetical protein OESDEN_19878 [Oesophagostomum dentatum]|nr:hypothetical protein OESDEN_19878 [Oesophagostomum dentatum]
MNGLLAIVKNEQDQMLDRDKATLSTKKDESASSPMSGMTRPISADGGSPTVDFGAKRESIGEDESGIDVMTVIGMAPSESPSSSGTASSISEDGPIFNVEVCAF